MVVLRIFSELQLSRRGSARLLLAKTNIHKLKHKPARAELRSLETTMELQRDQLYHMMGVKTRPTMAAQTSGSKSLLLSLPAEIRNKIWTFAFANTAAVPFHSSLSRRTTYPGGIPAGAAYDAACHGCAHRGAEESQDLLSVSAASSPLLTCRQIHTEAIVLYQTTLHVHACLTSELQLPEDICQRACAQRYLRHLSLRIHFDSLRLGEEMQEDMEEQWLMRLRDIRVGFPALETLHFTAHLRPPDSYDNLIDAIYFAGPLCHLPPRIRLEMDLNYISEDIMIDHPDLGRIWYSDALEEHTKVIKDCMADRIFRDAFHHNRSLDRMAERLLEITQEHEQSWFLSLRARNLRRIREENQQEARMNARMNGSR